MESWIYQLPVAVTTIVLAIVGGGIAYGKLSTRIDRIAKDVDDDKAEQKALTQKYHDMREDVRDIKHQQKLDALEIKNTLGAMSTLMQTSLTQMSKDMSSMSEQIEEANMQVAALHQQEHSHARELRAKMSGIETTLALMRGILHGSGLGIPSSPAEEPTDLPSVSPLSSPTPSHQVSTSRPQTKSGHRRQSASSDF